MSRKCARSPSVGRRTVTPRFPGVSRYSLSPLSLRYAKYASAFEDWVTPCHVLAIIASPRQGKPPNRMNSLPAEDSPPSPNRAAPLHRPSLDHDLDHVPADPVAKVAVRRHIQNEEAGPLPALPAANRRSQPHGVSRVDFRSDHHLSGREPVVVARHPDRLLLGFRQPFRIENIRQHDMAGR